MRILTVCTSTNVFGAEVVTLKMLEGFKRGGHEVLAITTTWTDEKFNERLALLHIPEVRLPFGSLSTRLSPRPMWWTFNAVVRLPWVWSGWHKAMRKFNPDVVIFTTWRHALTVYPFIDRPAFLIEYTYLEPTRTRRALYHLLNRKLAGFIAVSDFMRRHSITIGAPAEKVYLARSAVFSRFDPLRCERETLFDAQSPSRNLRVGIVGQIAPHKGHECLVDAVASLHQQQLAADIYVFGTGDAQYITALTKKVNQLGLENRFHWMGYEDDAAEIYRTFDVCVIPSLSGDPFPTVAMEAAAYGRPVIASRTGGLPEIVEHGVTGWLARPGDAEDFAAFIEQFITDRGMVRRFGEAARERVFSEFSQERMISDLEQIFHKTKRREKDER